MMDTLVIILIGLSAILWIWAVYDINKARIQNRISLLWLLLVLVFPMIGPIIYFQMKRRLLTR
jgi:Flp pilus assembly protein protease CpaA